MRRRAPHQEDGTAPRPGASGRATLLRVAAFGLAFGVLSSALNHVGGLVAVYASKTVDTAWAWLFVAFLASVTGKGWGAFVRSIGLLTPAVIGYYASDTLFGTYGPADDLRWLILAADVVVYLVLSVLVSAGLALLNIGIRSRGVIGILASVVVPGYIASDALTLYVHLVKESWADPYLVRVSLAVGLSAAVGSLVLVLVRTRLWLRSQKLPVYRPRSYPPLVWSLRAEQDQGMRTTDLALDALGRVHELIPAVLADLSADDLLWRPDPGSNSMGWLVWHLLRVEDDHIADLGGLDQVWADGWWERFALPYSSNAGGFGMSPSDVAAFTVTGPELLVAYADAVWQQTHLILGGLTDDDYERIVDTRWDPPVTLGVRLVSVINDTTQHVGQVGYLRGLRERVKGTDSGWKGYA